MGDHLSQITLSIGSALLERINPAYRQSSQPLDVSEHTSVADILATLGLNQDTALMIVLNDTMVARTVLTTQRLTHGDRLALMPPIHAG